MINNIIEGKSSICDQCNSWFFKDMEGQEVPLKNGIWPTSYPLILAAFYVALSIVRPWEVLFPWLGELRFERFYLLALFAVTAVSQKAKLNLSFIDSIVLFYLFASWLSKIFAVESTEIASHIVFSLFKDVLFYFVLRMVVRTPYELFFILITYVTTITVYLWKAQWEFFVHGKHRYDMGVIRMVGIEGTYGGPNSLAITIIASIPVGLLVWRYRHYISATWSLAQQKWFSRSLVLFFILTFSSIFLTNSRSGVVSLVFFVGLEVLSTKKFGKIFASIVVVALVGLIGWQFLPEANKGRVRTIWVPEEGPANAQASAEGRLAGFRAGIEMFKRYPVTGVGIGGFVDYRVEHLDGVAENAHNLIGQVLGSIGLVGGMAFSGILIAIFFNCRQIRYKISKARDPSLLILREAAHAFAISTLLLLFIGIFGHNNLRNNWIWILAFSGHCLNFSKTFSSWNNDYFKNSIKN